jgi:hypothetical protein
VKWSDGKFRVTANTRCTTTSPEQVRAMNVVRREVSERFGWDWSADAPKPVESIRFERLGKARFANPEEYEIRCTPQSLIITAQTERGFFNAAQTLVQMFQLDADGLYLPACELRDAPSLAFRGVHLFPGKGAMDFHRRLVERVLARHKINYVVLESSYAQWDADKNIWIDISVPKAELHEYAALLRENLIEPIPLVQSLGHVEWLFKNGQNLDIAEDPQAAEKLRAYAVTEPRTYDLMTKIYSEAIGVFRREILPHRPRRSLALRRVPRATRRQGAGHDRAVPQGRAFLAGLFQAQEHHAADVGRHAPRARRIQRRRRQCKDAGGSQDPA